MYVDYFKLDGRPYLAAPNTSRYFPATVIESARQTLGRAIERGAGPGLVIGPAGTGKTLLCHMLADEFEGRFAIALLTGGRLSSRQALLQAILYELGVSYQGLDEGELRLALVDFLEPRSGGNDGLLLIVDEAQTLPRRCLEEIRMLTNLLRGGQPRVRVVLAGSPQLEERFASPQLSAFSQRLAARCYLEALDSTETAAYARAQIARVGGNPSQVFDDEALRAVYRATDGVPRLINQVCDHALILASLAGVNRLTSEIIDEAWADLQQLPSPWSAPQRQEQGQIVEFGKLDDVGDESPSAIPFPVPQSDKTVEPEQQLDRIAEQLSHLEDEFKPVGSIGTEVELEFPEFGDPFSEQFAEEEVVLERYASTAELFAAAPRVSSQEGRQLGSLIDSFTNPYETGARRAAAAPAPQTPVTPEVYKVAARRPEATTSSQSTIVSGEVAQVTQRPAPVAVEARPFEPPAEQAADDDMIVVEDETRPTLVWTRKAAPAQKLEYRQLFAKLRRG